MDNRDMVTADSGVKVSPIALPYPVKSGKDATGVNMHYQLVGSDLYMLDSRGFFVMDVSADRVWKTIPKKRKQPYPAVAAGIRHVLFSLDGYLHVLWVREDISKIEPTKEDLHDRYYYPRHTRTYTPCMMRYDSESGVWGDVSEGMPEMQGTRVTSVVIRGRVYVFSNSAPPSFHSYSPVTGWRDENDSGCYVRFPSMAVALGRHILVTAHSYWSKAYDTVSGTWSFDYQGMFGDRRGKGHRATYVSADMLQSHGCGVTIDDNRHRARMQVLQVDSSFM
ncbi:hypothetical protein KIPB_006093 [Kipferlia bialata]|uniref:Uncharacterized protein n=1 Tax=Kipferlia bialata TaxID=797122 RepID=A0A9K3CWJ2_9EUKA|nr:hypothetical protein KIPB_006093 [Kipferlia bialata]|eukprot:g6093.t1